MQGVHRKEGGQPKAGPQCAGEVLPEGERQQHAAGVPEEILSMKGQGRKQGLLARETAGKEVSIELQRQPGERLPVAGMARGPGPTKTGGREALSDHG